MSKVTVQGNVNINSSGPDTGQGSIIMFKLSDYMKRSSDNYLIAPSVETFPLADTTGAFSASLESTRDATPAFRFWRVMVRGTFGGKMINSELGKIQIRSTPSPQNLYDLLADELITQGPNLTIVETPLGTLGGGNKNFSTSKTPALSTFILWNSASGGVVNPSAYTIDAQGNIVYAISPDASDFHLCSYSPVQ